MPDIDKETLKQAIKEGIKEWLNEQYAAFGRRTFYGIASAAFAGLVYLALTGAGWHK